MVIHRNLTIQRYLNQHIKLVDTKIQKPVVNRAIQLKHNTMKQLIYLAALCYMGLASSVCAQTKVGGGFAYGSSVSEAGLNLRAEIQHDNKISFVPTFTAFLTNTRNFENNRSIRSNWFDTGVNLNYLLIEGSKINFYGLAGLGFTTVHNRQTNFRLRRIIRWTNHRFNLNMGGGIVLNTSCQFQPFTEMKYNFSNASQLTVVSGILISVGS